MYKLQWKKQCKKDSKLPSVLGKITRIDYLLTSTRSSVPCPSGDTHSVTAWFITQHGSARKRRKFTPVPSLWVKKDTLTIIMSKGM